MYVCQTTQRIRLNATPVVENVYSPLNRYVIFDKYLLPNLNS